MNLENSVTFSENRGAFAPIKRYTVIPNFQDNQEGTIIRQITWTPADHHHVDSSFLQSLKITLRQVFLPYGYPASVSKDYVTYQIWDTLQAFASSITGALATEAVMKGVGVGNEAATPLAAALTWLLKSGSGHIGQITFAWAKGTSLDHDCKKWRLFADGLNDVATFVDLIVPLFPAHMTVFVLCTSSVARALVGVAGAATRAAVTQHQARLNNMADVSAKDGSQETLVNLLALITSLLLLPVVSGKMVLVWLLFIVFTGIHLFANYKAVTSLQFESLNRQRLLLCLQDYMRRGAVDSVKDVNYRESVVIGCGLKDKDVCGLPIKLGISVEEVLLHDTKVEEMGIVKAICNRKDKNYANPFIVLPTKHSINVILHENIEPRQIVEAFCRSVFLGVNRSVDTFSPKISEEWNGFKKLVESRGFTFTQAPLEAGDWRAKWIHDA